MRSAHAPCPTVMPAMQCPEVAGGMKLARRCQNLCSVSRRFWNLLLALFYQIWMEVTMSLVAFRIQCSFHLLLLSLEYHYCEESIIWFAITGWCRKALEIYDCSRIIEQICGPVLPKLVRDSTC